MIAVILCGPHKGNAEIPMRGHGANLLLRLDTRRCFGRRLHHALRSPLIVLHRGALLVLRLPRMVHLQPAMELVPASLKRDSCFYSIPHTPIFPRTSNNSKSQDVLMTSLSSEYFHLDRSCFCLPTICCCCRIASDLPGGRDDTNKAH